MLDEKRLRYKKPRDFSPGWEKLCFFYFAEIGDPSLVLKERMSKPILAKKYI